MTHTGLQHPSRRPGSRSGFTLIELLVVIGIILILLGLLFPAISMIRKQAMASQTRQEISRLQSAINAYYIDCRAYPGPIPDSMLAAGTTVTTVPYIPALPNNYPLTGINGTPTPTLVTGTENLWLGLCGGATFPGATPPPIVFGYTAPVNGPVGVASLNAANPSVHPSYMNYSPSETDYNSSSDSNAGEFSDGSNSNILPNPSATDSIIPEFVDHFSPARPILYLRARVGISCLPTANTMLNHIGSTKAATCQYDENQLTPYGWSATYTSGSTTSMGISTTDFMPPTTPTGDFTYTSDDAYFANPSQWGVPQGKDGYILISAGPDGIYGTKDDIIIPG